MCFHRYISVVDSHLHIHVAIRNKLFECRYGSVSTSLRVMFLTGDVETGSSFSFQVYACCNFCGKTIGYTSMAELNRGYTFGSPSAMKTKVLFLFNYIAFQIKKKKHTLNFG